MWPRASRVEFLRRQRRIRDLEWALAVRALHSCVPGRFLDVGSGNGYFLWKAAGIGFDPVGLEPEPGSRTPLPGTEGPWPVHAGRAEALPFPDESFDVVFACHALEHFSDRKQGLREMRRVLRSGGRAVILVPTGLMALQNTLNHLLFGTPFRLAKKLLGRIDTSWDRVLWPAAHGTGCRHAACEVRDFSCRRWRAEVGGVFRIREARGTWLYPYPDFPQWLPIREWPALASSLLLVCERDGE